MFCRRAVKSIRVEPGNWDPSEKARKAPWLPWLWIFCGFLTIFDLQNDGDEWSKHEQIGESGEI